MSLFECAGLARVLAVGLLDAEQLVLLPLGLDRRDRGLDVAVAGDHHDREIGVVLLDLLQELQAVELGALQPDVEEHQMRPAVGYLGERRIAVARGPGHEALVFEDARNEIPNIGLIIDNQNFTCHGSRLFSQLPVEASIFVESLVFSAGSLVSADGSFVSGSLTDSVTVSPIS